MKSIEVEVSDEMYALIEKHIASLTKPPRKQGADVIIEPVFRSVEEFLAEIIGHNFQSIASAAPTAEMQALDAQVMELQKRRLDLTRPKVKVK